jgi:hypothetical protein
VTYSLAYWAHFGALLRVLAIPTNIGLGYALKRLFCDVFWLRKKVYNVDTWPEEWNGQECGKK